MDNYQFFNNEKIKYLTHLISKIKVSESILDKYFNDRDVKLKLVLNSDFSDAKEEVYQNINNIKSRINNIDIMNIISLEDLEEISIDFDMLSKYIDYVCFG